MLIGWFGIDMWFLANSGRKGVGTFNDCKSEKRLVFQWVQVCSDYILGGKLDGRIGHFRGG